MPPRETGEKGEVKKGTPYLGYVVEQSAERVGELV
jgi:hypothetical protein